MPYNENKTVSLGEVRLINPHNLRQIERLRSTSPVVLTIQLTLVPSFLAYNVGPPPRSLLLALVNEVT